MRSPLSILGICLITMSIFLGGCTNNEQSATSSSSAAASSASSENPLHLFRCAQYTNSASS